MKCLLKEKFYIPVVFFLIPFLMYFFTRSISLDDTVSPMLASGLDDFDISKSQPHSPGFPVYIFLGKIVHFFIKSNLSALTFLSALSGALSVFIFYFLVREMFNKKTAFYSAFVMAVTPIFWVNSIVAVTDMVALLFLLISTYFIYSYIKNGNIKHLYIGSVLAGLTLGVRIHYVFTVIPFLIFAGIKIKDLKKRINTILFFVTSILSWLAPFVLITGPQKFFLAMKTSLFSFVQSENIFVIQDGVWSFINIFVKKIIDTFYYFLLSGYGVDIKYFKVFFAIFFLISLFVVYKTFLKHKIKSEKAKFILWGVVPYLFMLLLNMAPSNPRYFLILIPIFSICFVLVIMRFLEKERLIIFLFVLLLFTQTLTVVVGLHTQPSPMIQVLKYIENNYDKDNTVFVSKGIMLRSFEYYFKDKYSFLIVPDMNKFPNIETKEEYKGKKIIFVSNKDGWLGFNLVKTFHRDPRIYIRLNTIYLFEYSNGTTQ